MPELRLPKSIDDESKHGRELPIMYLIRALKARTASQNTSLHRAEASAPPRLPPRKDRRSPGQTVSPRQSAYEEANTSMVGFSSKGVSVEPEELRHGSVRASGGSVPRRKSEPGEYQGIHLITLFCSFGFAGRFAVFCSVDHSLS